MEIFTPRNYLDYMAANLLSFFPLLRKSWYLNVAGLQKTSGEYLQYRIFRSVLLELEHLLRKKQLTISRQMTLKFSDAQGVILYKILLELPLPADQIFGNMARQAWLDQLDEQIVYHLNPEHEKFECR